jgi:hypothetical protein
VVLLRKSIPQKYNLKPAAELNVMQRKKGDQPVGQAIGNVKWVLRIEGLAILTFALFFYSYVGFNWATFFIYFLLPDLSFLGYIFGNKVGAITYNCAHSYIGPVIVFSLFLNSGIELFHIIGLIWAAHIGFDRALGYGLKYEKGFSYTHLGKIGKEKNA